MNIVIAEIIAKNFKVGDVVTSVIVRDLDNGRVHLNNYSSVLNDLVVWGAVTKQKKRGKIAEFKIIGDVSIAINAEIKKRESSKLSSREGSFSRAFPEHLIDKFNSLLAGVRA
ncbi:hypothetical protein [Providencia stuartii]|uniref:hypothetical protein n=1 Tax=Providencia stuartii TaxID=588 RepID=UPI00289035B3|nr:hypothetical protein [Providencia stuartii]MDT2041079.1 hypothetical protein [Providencia stuartii]